MKTDILNVKFDVVRLEDVVDIILKKLSVNKKFFLVTANPEIVMYAHSNKYFKKILDSADMIVADGIGIVFASMLNSIKLRERIAGYDLIQKLFYKLTDTSYNIYFLGSTKKNVALAYSNMKQKYHGLNIVGTHHGFFYKQNDDEQTEDSIKKIIDNINYLNTDILLVGLGSPRQEEFIYKYKDVINAKIFIGVGGSFDVMSGVLKRAPVFFQRCGFEWLYRFMLQPKRFFRLCVLPKFIFCIITNKLIKIKIRLM
jgi:N-acetylglucosaminyldiphosphoundecaprenol N-acetyl-beta-D-mannosaminyltransferase